MNLSYDFTTDVMVYGKYSSGYKSGGANSRSLSYSPFDPESVRMFEAGAKTQFWDNRARLNVAAYAGQYRNIQLDFSALYQQIDPAKACHCLTVHCLNLDLIADIDLNGQGLTAERLDLRGYAVNRARQLIGGLRGLGGDDDIATRPRQAKRDGSADAAARSRDDGYPTLQYRHIGSSL